MDVCRRIGDGLMCRETGDEAVEDDGRKEIIRSVNLHNSSKGSGGQLRLVHRIIISKELGVDPEPQNMLVMVCTVTSSSLSRRSLIAMTILVEDGPCSLS